MAPTFKRCISDDDYAQASLFLLKHKRDLHPAFTALRMAELIYAYVTQGRLLLALDAESRVIAAAAYYHGTTDEEFHNSGTALIDITIMDPAYRGTRLFLRGLGAVVDAIADDYPEVREIRLAALEANGYLCRLYAKFAVPGPARDGAYGREVVFCRPIDELRDTLVKFYKV